LCGLVHNSHGNVDIGGRPADFHPKRRAKATLNFQWMSHQRSEPPEKADIRGPARQDLFRRGMPSRRRQVTLDAETVETNRARTLRSR
jgi:hypothetical protein